MTNETPKWRQENDGGSGPRHPVLTWTSPAYLARRGPPGAIDELARRDCVVIRRPQLVDSAGEVWRLRSGDRIETVKVGGPLATDDLTPAREAVRLGMGIGLLPNMPDFTEGLTRPGLAVTPAGARPCGPIPRFPGGGPAHGAASRRLFEVNCSK